MPRVEATPLVDGNPEAAVDLILQLVATVESLTERAEELEHKIALCTRDSSNSSKPPSSDGLTAKPGPSSPKKSKKRNDGGQPGHKEVNRGLIPTEEVDEVIPVCLQAGDRCGAILTRNPHQPTGKCWRHQVVDIPKPRLEVTDLRLQCIQCSCGTENCGKILQMAR
jgi:transposase